jgi:hypothetical protein
MISCFAPSVPAVLEFTSTHADTLGAEEWHAAPEQAMKNTGFHR